MDRERRQSPHITLIGMSNIGKTYWAGRLATEAGFEHVDCDTLIKQKLTTELKVDLHGKNMATWMGQPYESQYTDSSQKYLAAENAIMQSIITRLRNNKLTRPLVIDTSGSVIYTDGNTLQDLGSLTRMVYLETSTEHIAELFKRYVEQPKPVIWGNMFEPRSSETSAESLQRCYPLLLNARAQRYVEIAHTRVPFDVHEDPAATSAIFT